MNKSGDRVGATKGTLALPHHNRENEMTKYILAIAAVLAAASPASAYNEDFLQMLSETGCKSRFSDDKKADLFDAKYKGKQMTVTGEITLVSGDEVHIKLLRSTLTSDITVTMLDKRATYDLEKGQRITASFAVSFHGGCFLRACTH
jgi:hypothetical protein